MPLLKNLSTALRTCKLWIEARHPVPELLYHVHLWTDTRQYRAPFFRPGHCLCFLETRVMKYICFVMFYLCLRYTLIYSACKTTRQDSDLQLWLISPASCKQHIQVINILMVTSWRRRRGWRKTEVHTSSAYETKSKWLRQRASGLCGRAAEREKW